MSLISVILPTCDRPELVGRALRSVLAQREVELEVVLVDSNRTAASVAQNPDLAELLTDPRVQVVAPRPAPVNAAAARNVGLDAARGKWISYLDDDDAYREGKLAAQLALAESSGASLVVCGYEVVMEHRRRVRQCDQAEFAGDSCLIGANYPTPVMFHRAVTSVRFNPAARSGHDHLFAIDLLAETGQLRVPCVTRPLLDMHAHAGPRVNLGNRAQVWQAHRLCLKRHRGRFSRKARRAFIAVGLLVKAQGEDAPWSDYCWCLWRILATQGPGSWRLVLNALAVRSPRLRRWVVT